MYLRTLRLRPILLTSFLLIVSLSSFAQDDDDLFSELDEITTVDNHEVIAAFKSTRIMLGQSIERVRAKQLHFRISHVFGRIIGVQNFFGLDNLNNMHLSFEYGLTDYIQLGLSRSNKPDKTYSSSLKLSILRQKEGGQSFPLSLSYYGGIDYKSRDYVPVARDNDFVGRLDYVNQVLVGSKVTNNLSLQLSPTWVHINLTEEEQDPNDIYSLGIGGRYLFSRSMSFNFEYYYTLPTFDTQELDKNMLTIGFDIETGGHVFQLYFTNAFVLHPGKFATNQNGDFFGNREINFGFSMLRTFNL